MQCDIWKNRHKLLGSLLIILFALECLYLYSWGKSFTHRHLNTTSIHQKIK